MDWLNQRTGEDTAFFGVVVEAWTIDDSRPAPRFVPITFPNDWQKQSVRGERGSGSGQVSERGQRYRRFFQALIDTLREKHKFTSAEKGPAAELVPLHLNLQWHALQRSAWTGTEMQSRASTSEATTGVRTKRASIGL